ncbi:internal virion protein D [Roseobacter phage CRP-804]|uniref:Internal virion protein D n=1 Tax=Roseobacter phage CRP-804 TaxID=3072850 RepID=A0AAX3ZVX8_9CAUD|nr:internal virion protein D [Roseobacter phage CRP-804]
MEEENQVTPPQEVLDRLYENRNNPSVLLAFDHHFGQGAASQYLDGLATQAPQGEDLVIPQPAIDLLNQNRDDPAFAVAFNRRYGAGMADRVLNPPQEEVPTEGRGESTFFDVAIRAPAAGLEDAVSGIGRFGDYVGDSIFGPTGRFVWGDGNGVRWVSADEFAQMEQDGLINPEGIDYIGDAETTGGRIIQGVTSFAVPYVGAAGGLAKVTQGASIIRGLIAGAVVDGVVMNPDDPNLTAALEMMGADMGLVGELLATDPNDPEWMNRARNIAEGGVLGIALEGIFHGLRAAAGMRGGAAGAAEGALRDAETTVQALDGEIGAAGRAVAEDASESVNVGARVFSETPDAPPPASASGEVAADAATAAPQGTPRGATPFRMTPEQVEQVRYYSRLAADNPEAAARSTGLSFRSVDTLNDYDDVLAEISATARVMGEEFDRIKGGGSQSWEVVQAQAGRATRTMAEMLGEDADTLIARFSTANVPHSQLAGELLAREKFLLNLEQEIKGLAEMINTGRVQGYETLDEAILAFNARREIAANLLANNNALRSNVARALNAMKISRTGDKNLRNLITQNLSITDARAVARAVAESDKPMQTVMGLGSRLQRIMDRVNHYRINALLSGVGTQEVNAVGTAINSVMIPMQQILGGEAKHGVRTLAHMLASSRESLRLATRSFKEDSAILDALSTKLDFEQELAKGSKNWADTIISSPSRLLLTMDEFFKQATYRGRITADALGEADRMGLRGQERDDFIQTYLRDSFGPNGEAIRGEALLQSQRSTFTEPLESGSFAQKFQSMGRGKGAGAAAFRFVFPFIRTPVNILSQSLQNMPALQFLSSRFREDLAAGGIRAAQARGKMVTGTALLVPLYFLAGRGDLTGSGPSDPRVRAEWINAGNRPYSIRFRNEDGTVSYFNYQRYEPIANVISVVADFNEIMSDPYNEREASKLPLGAALMLAFAENTVNKTFTQGLSNFIDILQGDPMSSEAAMYNTIGSFVPNILNQTNGDEHFREVRSMADALMSRTGLYNDVDPRRNVLGEVLIRPVPKYDPLGLTTLGDSAPVDPVNAELSRISIADGSAFQMPTSRYYLDGEMVDLRDMPYQGGPQSMYDRLQELTSTVEINGRTLREQLAETITNQDYLMAPDGGRGLSSGDTKGSIISQVITAYRDAAKAEFPEFQEFYERHRISQQQALRDQFEGNLEAFRGTSIERFNSFYEAFQ